MKFSKLLATGLLALAIVAGGVAGWRGLVAQNLTAPFPSIFTTAGNLVVSSSRDDVRGIASVATGQVLTSQGAGAIPAWSNVAVLATFSGSALDIGAAATTITQIRVYSETWSPVQVSASSCEEQVFSVTGLTTADKIFVNAAPFSSPTGFVSARVSATDVLAALFCNLESTAPYTPAGGTHQITAIRS